MVNIEQQIIFINALLTNHEYSHRDSRTCPNPITDILSHIKTVLVTNRSTDIYNDVLNIYYSEYEDDTILIMFRKLTDPMPLVRTPPYMNIQQLTTLLTNITDVISRYITDFVPPPPIFQPIVRTFFRP